MYTGGWAYRYLITHYIKTHNILSIYNAIYGCHGIFILRTCKFLSSTRRNTSLGLGLIVRKLNKGWRCGDLSYAGSPSVFSTVLRGSPLQVEIRRQKAPMSPWRVSRHWGCMLLWSPRHFPSHREEAGWAKYIV